MLTNHPPNSPLNQPQSLLYHFPLFTPSSPAPSAVIRRFLTHFWSGPLAFQGLDFPHSWLSNEPSFVRFGPVVVEIWRFCVLERLWSRMLILGDLERVPSRFFGHTASLSGSCHRAIHPIDQTSPWVSTAYPLLIPPTHFCLSHQSSLYRIPIIPILILELFARAIHPSPLRP
ncbi:hypothetical protein DFJ58DRAFT_732868 [Suillus subalutaceus]|uniref:uncharacterized protein n=1 Tax=Suillus subalutaceus TaxID=48586 RepID=UPI001B87FC52|nr:uncharacterized protein DFJ58DRAFT_732868 [Suillus subalutaceus]KAG1840500.1 hypothetical protein DFJ58DRAFT_732868 [Suillus subalutaceus]